ncbi:MULTISPECIES: nuclear transport factor 2 family protein [Pseudomonas]|uniref:nuclear transport factor 2 family protein n=1 Tax=Pseudomonas TaxID=286 RepID=UPI001FB6D023|nr:MULTISPECIES: nuclear transport factor 2 family protein [Pseudomonas]MDT8906337.1 nuclear transport factor 2 family protein [Pseudomonas prosekii]
MTLWTSLIVRLQFFLLCLILPGAVWASQAYGQDANAHRVHQSFVNWQQGKGSVFDLLAPNARWTVAGSSPVSGVYESKADLMDRAVRPITARLATPIFPTVQSIVAENDIVVVLWSGKATALDQQPYNNTYLWHMKFKDGKVIEVTALLDTYVLNDLLHRVKPAG